MAAASSNLTALPVAVHHQAVTRLSQAELVQFESMLATADDSIESVMRAREGMYDDELDDGDEAGARAIVQSMVEAMAALTETPPPVIFKDKTTAVNWVYRTMISWRDRDRQEVMKGNHVPGMSAETIATCMELITKLNTSIGGDPTYSRLYT